MSFLYLLEDLRCPFLDTVMQIITYCGEELVFMALAIICYWCVSKAEGYYILFVGFLGTVINQCLKLFFRIPRPWVRDPNFKAVESALDGATGYSFPSGHTQSVTGTFGAIAIWNKKLWLRIACVAIIVLTAFSRMYLGVHTPKDVLVGAGMALVLILLLRPIATREDKGLMKILFPLMLVVGMGYLLFVELYRFPEDVDGENLASGIKNAYTLLGAIVGMAIVYIVDEKKLHFPVKAVWWAQLLKIALGLVVVLAVKSGLKTPLNLIFGGHRIADGVRYFLVVIAAGILWPLTFPWFSKLGKKES